MKREEIALFILEFIKKDANDLKVLDRIEYVLIQMLDWETIIDLDQDGKFMKHLISKGVG
jgi:hypothetical protein